MSIPRRFYSWFMLIFVAASILIGRDWGFMYWAETRARKTGEVVDENVSRGEGDGRGSQPTAPPTHYTLVQTSTHAEIIVRQGIPIRWWNAVLPFFALVGMFVPMLFYSGATQANGGVGWDAPVRDIIGNADAWATLHWVGGFTIVLQIVLYAAQYDAAWGGCLLRPAETIDAAMNGGVMYLKGSLALLLAFAYAQTLKDLQISKYLIDMLADSLTEAELPALVFILCAVFSMATGSWGTMTVFMPSVIPLAAAVGGPENTNCLTNVISAVLGGAVWGDHCSPVSDTTILSAASSQVSLIDHTKTQLPYALFAGAAAILFGFMPCGAGCPAGVCILLGLVLIPLFHLLLSFIPRFGGAVPIYNPKVGGATG